MLLVNQIITSLIHQHVCSWCHTGNGTIGRTAHLARFSISSATSTLFTLYCPQFWLANSLMRPYLHVGLCQRGDHEAPDHAGGAEEASHAGRDELHKDRSSGKADSQLEKRFSLENSLWESIFREDLFLYNCLQTSSATWAAPSDSSPAWARSAWSRSSTGRAGASRRRCPYSDSSSSSGTNKCCNLQEHWELKCVLSFVGKTQQLQCAAATSETWRHGRMLQLSFNLLFPVSDCTHF